MPLPFDVVFMITHFLDRHHVLPYMQTCRTLYFSCVHILLRSPVILTQNQSVASFHQFMQADTSTRFPLLRKLRLDLIESPSSDSLDRIAEILALAANLEDLDLNVLGDTICRRGFVFVNALTRLTRFKAVMSDNTLPELLSQLKSPLAVADLQYMPSGPAISPAIDDPISVLSPFRLTLETLRIHDVETINPDVVFPRVRCLTLSSAYMTSLQPFVSICPNLRELHLDGSQLDYVAWINGTTLDRIREGNKVQQEARHWPRLDRLSGSFLQMAFYGIVSPAEELVLEDVMWNTDWDPNLHTVVNEVRPSRLVLHVQVRNTMVLPPELLPTPQSFAYLHISMKIPSRSLSNDDLVIYLVRTFGRF
ncbi:hypothetical protein OF83DRAFT_439355 [Amylostereum chailletii]|nr:hypothetical protein OF83DRAFT_439355 [Amylostereum chailletii]